MPKKGAKHTHTDRQKGEEKREDRNADIKSGDRGRVLGHEKQTPACR